jgi:regulatory protein
MDLRTAIYRYCNYQERCHSEVRNKLFELGAATPEVEELMAELVQADILNEERFARSYARGKFRIKQWGKNKIINGLRAHRVSDYCIRKGLQEIPDEEYKDALVKEAEKALYRYRTQKPLWKQHAAAYKYLLSHGWESNLIQSTLKQVGNTG